MKNLSLINRTNVPGKKLKSLRTDNGGEHLSNKFNDYLTVNSIKHQFTIAYTPQYIIQLRHQ